MQHLNYCRQILSSGDLDVFQPAFEEGKTPKFLKEVIQSAVKFAMPSGGIAVYDEDLRAINENKRIRLPFKNIALEFSSEDGRNVLVAGEHIESDSIFVVPIIGNAQGWLVLPHTRLDMSGAVKRDETGTQYKYDFDPNTFLGENGDSPLRGAAGTILAFLNALACKNVHIEKSPAKATKKGKKVKAALPFDDYHFLTVDVPGKAGVRSEGFGGSHRSPREHLRRGHIRRLESGPIWVNACVVNAGIGSKVGKSYLLRKSA